MKVSIRQSQKLLRLICYPDPDSAPPPACSTIKATREDGSDGNYK